LTERQAGEVDAAVRARNVADCREGRDGCDYSRLDVPDSQAISGVERARNLAACQSGRGYCDRSRLTPAQAASILKEGR
jgi:hypothetical protein